MSLKTRLGWGLILFSGCLAAQDVVTNPRLPPAPEAGRVVTLRPEEAVKPGKGPSALRKPMALAVAPDGSLIFQEGVRLVKFDAAGNFVRELFSGASGKTVMVGDSSSGSRRQIAQSGLSFLVRGSEVVLLDLNAGAIRILDLDGKSITDIPLEEPIMGGRLVMAGEDRYLVSGRLFPSSAGPMMRDPSLFSVSGKGAVSAPMAVFSSRVVPVSDVQDGPIRTTQVQMMGALTVALRGDRAYVNHTPEFQVTALDLQTGKILRVFQRAFDRVENDDAQASPAGLSVSGMTVSPPRLKLKNDISGLFPRENLLWIMTSTQDKTKGTLVDVFDDEGRYLDCFYLKAEIDGLPYAFSGAQTWIFGDEVYFAAAQADGTSRILKSALDKGL